MLKCGHHWEPKTGVQMVTEVLDHNTVATPTQFRWEGYDGDD